MLSKSERVSRTLSHRAVDRVAIHDVVSSNERLIAFYAEKDPADELEMVRKIIDLWRPPFFMIPDVQDAGLGVTDHGWTKWVTEHPFHDADGLKEYLLRDAEMMERKREKLDAAGERERFAR